MANGDITLTSTKTISVTGLVLQMFNIDFANSVMTVSFAEVATGIIHVARITDASCVGFDLTAGTFTDNITRAISGELTGMIGTIFGAGSLTPGQRKTAGVQKLVTDGVITVAGTVA